LKLSNEYFNYSLILQKEYGSRIQRLLTLPSTPRIGGTIIAVEIWKNTGHQRKLKTRNNSRVWLRKLNNLSLIRKSRKLPIRSVAYGNS